MPDEPNGQRADSTIAPRGYTPRES
jgi:hypothetical protein